jgi:phage-related minor tail protein
MNIGLMLLRSLHVLSAIFWAGSTFVLARTGGVGIEALRRPKIGAAVVAVLTGAGLAAWVHGGAFGRTEQVLMVAIVASLTALIVQLVDRASPARSQRIAAGLLMIAVVGMVSARYIA